MTQAKAHQFPGTIPPIPYRLIQQQKSGTRWESEVFFAATLTEVCQVVRAGFCQGEPRCAVDAEDGTVIYALDRHGMAL